MVAAASVSVAGASPAVLVSRGGGALQHEGAEGSERSTTKRRENKHGWSSPRWGTNDSGSDFDGAKGSPAEGMDKMQLGGAYEAVACFTLRKKHG
jgi:hypothetical protein